MSRRLRQGAMRLFGAMSHSLTVVDAWPITPSMVRLRCESRTLFDDLDPTPAAFLRLWLPGDDGDEDVYQRASTIIDPEPRTGRFDLAVAHATTAEHRAGPGMEWAASVRPGDQVETHLLSSDRSTVVDGEAGVVLIGDLAALPALNNIMATIGPHRDVSLVWEHRREEGLAIPVAEHPRLALERVQRRDAGSLAEALAASGIPLADRAVWAAGESGSIKALRAQAKARSGATKADTAMQAYWYEGKSMGNPRR